MRCPGTLLSGIWKKWNLIASSPHVWHLLGVFQDLYVCRLQSRVPELGPKVEETRGLKRALLLTTEEQTIKRNLVS